MKIEYEPIGVIRSPFHRLEGMPIQPSGAVGVKGTVEIYQKYVDGLKDLNDFSHIILLYHFHQSRGFALQLTPFMDTQHRGLFATRAPRRPNPIGLSIVRLLRITGGRIAVENIDVLDKTPLLDVKPYVPAFDRPSGSRAGWLEHVQQNVSHLKSDSRFK